MIVVFPDFLLFLMSLLLAVYNKTCLEKSVTKLYELCHEAVIMHCLFLTVLWVGLQCVVLAVPGHTHLRSLPIAITVTLNHQGK